MPKKKGHGEGQVERVKTLPDGKGVYRWRIRATQADGKYARASGTTKGTLADARREMQAARAALEKGAGAALDARTVTVSMLLDNWLAEHATRVRSKTVENNAQLIKKYLVPYLGAVKVRALTAGAIQQFHRTLLAESGVGRTRQLVHGVLSQALDHAVILGIIDTNPARVVRVPPPPPLKRLQREADEGRVNALDKREREYLYRVAIQDGTPHAWAVVLAAALGLRRGEIYGLRLIDLDLTEHPGDAPHGLLHVRQIIAAHTGADRTGAPKTNRSRRTLRMNATARQAVNGMLAWRAQHATAPGWKDSGLLFVDETGAAQRPGRARDKFNALQKAMHNEMIDWGARPKGTPCPEPLSFHALRFTFVSVAHLDGYPLDDIARVCGHDPLVCQRIYKQVFDQRAPLIMGVEYREPEPLDPLDIGLPASESIRRSSATWNWDEI